LLHLVLHLLDVFFVFLLLILVGLEQSSNFFSFLAQFLYAAQGLLLAHLSLSSLFLALLAHSAQHRFVALCSLVLAADLFLEAPLLFFHAFHFSGYSLLVGTGLPSLLL
jgi:hypothetical protein